MATRLFLSEARLEAWIAEGRAEIDDAGVRLLEEDVALSLAGAIHVLALVEGRDERSWLGRVLPEASLREAGAEILGSTMVAGETAYEIVPGFIVAIEEARDATSTYLEVE